jgi:hypothetical protein
MFRLVRRDIFATHHMVSRVLNSYFNQKKILSRQIRFGLVGRLLLLLLLLLSVRTKARLMDVIYHGAKKCLNSFLNYYVPYTHRHNPLFKRNRSLILTSNKDQVRILISGGLLIKIACFSFCSLFLGRIFFKLKIHARFNKYLVPIVDVLMGAIIYIL